MENAQNLTALTSDAVAQLRQLVAFDTTSRHSNLSLITYVEQYLQGFGFRSTRIENADGSKASLFARIGPDKPGGIVLSGHTDVVPVDGQSWATPPFTLTESLGKCFGRGTADMKGFLACVLALVPALAGARLSKPFYLAFSYDEEIGCLGAPDLVKHLVQHAPSPALAVVGEPTGMQVVTAHKGVYSFKTEVTGLEVHSSLPHRGVNAVQVAARLVAFLADIADEVAREAKDAQFDPPYTTVHVGVMNGGTARNIIPRTCEFCWEIRPLPGDDPERIVARFEALCDEWRARMQQVSPQADIRTTRLSRMLGMRFESGEGMRQAVLAAAQANETHAVSFGTEAGIFQEHGIPVLVCGPGHIAQAHKPDEFVEITQLEQCLRFLLRLGEGLR